MGYGDGVPGRDGPVSAAGGNIRGGGTPARARVCSAGLDDAETTLDSGDGDDGVLVLLDVARRVGAEEGMSRLDLASPVPDLGDGVKNAGVVLSGADGIR